MAYMLLSFLKLAFLSHVSPFKTIPKNRLEKLNELTVLFVGYLGCAIIYSSFDPAMINNVGFLMFYVIISKILFNLVLVTKDLFKDLKLKLRKVQYTRKKKRFNNKMNRLKGKKKLRIQYSKSVVSRVAAKRGLQL